MRQNIGIADQNARILASVAMMTVAAAVGGQTLLLGCAGALLLLTANFGLCPLYVLIGVDTCNDRVSSDSAPQGSERDELAAQ
ncbi:MAG: DUF2892 domain-containing protein [Steroidobacteraceae bacterium]